MPRSLLPPKTLSLPKNPSLTNSPSDSTLFFQHPARRLADTSDRLTESIPESEPWHVVAGHLWPYPETKLGRRWLVALLLISGVQFLLFAMLFDMQEGD